MEGVWKDNRGYPEQPQMKRILEEVRKNPSEKEPRNKLEECLGRIPKDLQKNLRGSPDESQRNYARI